jgi:glutamate formiminotransferase
MVGPPDDVAEAAFRAIAEAVRTIDMREHRGVHPRIGAADVCPFVPLRGISMDRCVALARRLGERVGGELEVPVFLYGEAATTPARRGLADLRRGGYRALLERMKQPRWQPDFGPATGNDRAGAAAIGARPLLIAYNINLATRDVRVARQIARRMRESTGGLPRCQAKGWYIEEYGCAQVTLNLLDYRVTGLHRAFSQAVELARAEGVRVTGSEVVGMVPAAALVAAGRAFLVAGGNLADAPDGASPIDIAVAALGLCDRRSFDSRTKILPV